MNNPNTVGGAKCISDLNTDIDSVPET